MVTDKGQKGQKAAADDGAVGEIVEILSSQARAGMRGRPAETGGALAAIGAAVAYMNGAHDPTTLATMLLGVGLVPGAITLLVDNGGVRGVLGKVWRGKDA